MGRGHLLRGTGCAPFPLTFEQKNFLGAFAFMAMIALPANSNRVEWWDELERNADPDVHIQSLRKRGFVWAERRCSAPIFVRLDRAVAARKYARHSAHLLVAGCRSNRTGRSILQNLKSAAEDRRRILFRRGRSA